MIKGFLVVDKLNFFECYRFPAVYERQKLSGLEQLEISVLNVKQFNDLKAPYTVQCNVETSLHMEHSTSKTFSIVFDTSSEDCLSHASKLPHPSSKIFASNDELLFSCGLFNIRKTARCLWISVWNICLYEVQELNLCILFFFWTPVNLSFSLIFMMLISSHLDA